MAAGRGVAPIPTLAARGLTTEGVALKKTRPALTRRINALVPDGRTEPSVALLLRTLRAVAAE